jgi:hypothetical protein
MYMSAVARPLAFLKMKINFLRAGSPSASARRRRLQWLALPAACLSLQRAAAACSGWPCPQRAFRSTVLAMPAHPFRQITREKAHPALQLEFSPPEYCSAKRRELRRLACSSAGSE